MDYEETVAEMLRLSLEMKRAHTPEAYEELEEQFDALKAYLHISFPVEVNSK